MPENSKIYNGSVVRLRQPERLEVMQVNRVVKICLKQGEFKTVLDCGTGSGVFAEAFHKEGLTVSGVDLNPDMIAAAKEYVPDAEFKVGHLNKLPYADKSFDLVFYAHSLHEADDLSKLPCVKPKESPDHTSSPWNGRFASNCMAHQSGTVS